MRLVQNLYHTVYHCHKINYLKYETRKKVLCSEPGTMRSNNLQHGF